MAYEDLKRIAGVHVGAFPSFGAFGQKPPPTNPQVTPSPFTAAKLALGRAGARDLRLAAVSPTRVTPALASAVQSVAAQTSAPAPALAQTISKAPLNLGVLAKAAGVIEATPSIPLPPPPPPPPALPPPPDYVAPPPPPPDPASAIQSVFGAVAVADHHDDTPALPPPMVAPPPPDAPPPPPDVPPSRILTGPTSTPFGAVLRAAAPAILNTPAPTPASAPAQTFAPVSRASAAAILKTAPPPAAAKTAPHRGFAPVSRNAVAAIQSTTTKGRGAMASRYKGTGEITYCPINSNGDINAGADATLPGVRPQRPFQAQELLIDPVTGATFAINDVKIGNDPVSVAAGSVSAGNFPPQNGPKFQWKVADGVDIIFSVTNTGTVTVAFTAMLVGEVVEPY